MGKHRFLSLIDSSVLERLNIVVTYLQERDPIALISLNSLVVSITNEMIEAEEAKIAEYYGCTIDALHAHPEYIRISELGKTQFIRGAKKRNVEVEGV